MLFALICLTFSDDDIWLAGVEANQHKKKRGRPKKNWRTGAGVGGTKIGGPCPKNSRSAPKKFAAAKKNWRSLGSKRPSAKKIGGLPNLNAACQKKTRFAKTLIFKNWRPPKKKLADSEKKISGRAKKNSRSGFSPRQKKTRPPKKKNAVCCRCFCCCCCLCYFLYYCRTAAHCAVFGCFCC